MKRCILRRVERATHVGMVGKDGKVILESANPDYAPMVFSDGVELIGKVVSVLRRYP